MRYFLPFFMLLSAQICLAQHSTLKFSDKPFGLEQQSMLVVPFQEKMYLSDANGELAKTNQMTTDQIIERFSNALDQSIYYAFRDRCQLTNFRNFDGDSVKSDLQYVYSKVDLEYELVKKDEKSKNGIQALKKKFSKKDKQKDAYDRGGIEGGEVVTRRDERERYMKTVVKEQSMLDSLHSRFHNEFILFLNELDFKVDYSDALAMQNMQYERELKVHFSLYAKSGEILATGISRTSLPATENDINLITSKYFPILAKNIFEALFPAEEEETSEAKVKLPWK